MTRTNLIVVEHADAQASPKKLHSERRPRHCARMCTRLRSTLFASCATSRLAATLESMSRAVVLRASPCSGHLTCAAFRLRLDKQYRSIRCGHLRPLCGRKTRFLGVSVDGVPCAPVHAPMCLSYLADCPHIRWSRQAFVAVHTATGN